MRHALAALLLVVLSPPAMPDSDGAWSNLGNMCGPKPAIFDSHRHRMVVIPSGNEIQWLDLDVPSHWNRQAVSFGGRIARDRSVHVYDAIHDRIIAFGGQRQVNGTTELFADVWELSLAAESPEWSQVEVPGPGIDPRSAAAAVYDSLGNRLLVFGGLRNDPGLGLVPSSDIWSLSLGSSPAWTQIVPSSANPLPRLETHAVLDRVRRRLIIVAGRRQSSVFSDIWAWSLTGGGGWTQLKEQTNFDYTPGQRWAASVVIDPDHDRIVLFGGRTNDTSNSAQNNDRSDAYEFPLSGGSWTKINVQGPGPRSSASTIYDPGDGRMVIFGGQSGYFPIKPTIASTPLADAWTLSLRSSANWGRLNPPVTERPAFPTEGPFIVPRRDLAVAIKDSQMWTRDSLGFYTSASLPNVSMRVIGVDSTTSKLVGLSMSTNPAKFIEIEPRSGAWTSVLIAGQTPDFQSIGHIGWDPVHRRAVVTGVVHDPVFDTTYPAVFRVDLDPDASAWVPYAIAGSAPGGTESFRIYDPVRDRFLVTGTSHPGDVYALTLGAQATWSLLGRLPFPYNAGSWSYDASRDRVLQVGYGNYGGGPTDGREVVSEWPLASSPTWNRLHPEGVSPIPIWDPLSGYDPVHDRLIVFTGPFLEQDHELVFGEPLRLSLGCGPDVVWSAGSSVPVSWDVSNPTSSSRIYDWTLTVDRNWPGYPQHGQMVVNAGETQTLTLQVPAPDSASVGTTLLTLGVEAAEMPTTAASCTRHLHDATTPTLLSFADGAIENGAIVVSWFGADDAGLSATLERKREGEDWSFLATLTGDASGRFAYRDEAPIRDARSIYRLSVGSSVSESRWFRFGDPALRLALSGGVHVLAAGGLDVAFTLPAAGRARFLLVDAAGRRVLDRAFEGLGPGEHTLRLTPDRELRAGVYFLRLEQGTIRARAKVVALP